MNEALHSRTEVAGCLNTFSGRADMHAVRHIVLAYRQSSMCNSLQSCLICLLRRKSLVMVGV